MSLPISGAMIEDRNSLPQLCTSLTVLICITRFPTGYLTPTGSYRYYIVDYILKNIDVIDFAEVKIETETIV